MSSYRSLTPPSDGAYKVGEVYRTFPGDREFEENDPAAVEALDAMVAQGQLESVAAPPPEPPPSEPPPVP